MLICYTGMTFTSGSGNEVVCVAMETLAKRIVGMSLAALTENMSVTYRTLVSGQIRWIGPEVHRRPRLIIPPRTRAEANAISV
jgi:hypothetical protein